MSRKWSLRRTKTILPLIAVFLLAANISEAKYSGGTGEPNNPYRIETPNDLNDIGNHIEDFNKCFVLVNDINLADYNGMQFNIIGEESSPFSGVFDGNGHTVSNFTYASDSQIYVGLFAYVSDPNAEIRAVTLAEPNVSSRDAVGAVVGWMHAGRISHCGVLGGSVWAENIAGGLVGYLGFESGNPQIPGALVSNCFATCIVEGAQNGDNIGGLVGNNIGNGRIVACYATGSVSGDGCIGGLSGGNSGTIADCYASGSVSGEGCLGGLVGCNYFTGQIDCSFSVGAVAKHGCFGGLVASNRGSVFDSFWDVDSSGVGTSNGGTGKTTAEMQTESTFTDAGWDFVGETVNGPNDIWRMCIDGVSYPLLWWQFTCGDFVCPDGVTFIDYTVLANHWRDINCSSSNDCDRTDLDFSDNVDWADLKIFCDHWLQGAAP